MKLFPLFCRIAVCIYSAIAINACSKSDKQGTTTTTPPTVTPPTTPQTITRHFYHHDTSLDSEVQNGAVHVTRDSFTEQRDVTISGWGTQTLHLLDFDINRIDNSDSIASYWGHSHGINILSLTYYKYNDSIYMYGYTNHTSSDGNQYLEYERNSYYYSIK